VELRENEMRNLVRAIETLGEQIDGGFRSARQR
jgi:hypothetical protein